MRALFVYVVGRLSETPSTTRGYNSLAHDIVEWWDQRVQHGARISDFLALRDQIIAALTGVPDASLRPIRPSRRTRPDASFDDLRVILESSDPASVRMMRVRDRLRDYQKRNLIPAPVIDAPKELHLARWESGDLDDQSSEVPGTCIAIAGGGKNAGLDLKRALSSGAADCDIVVCFDAKQREYIECLAGTDIAPAAAQMNLRHFVVKEQLGPGLPLRKLQEWVSKDGCDGDNLAEAMRCVARSLRALELLPGIVELCGISVQDAIDRGVRFRCKRLVDQYAGHADRVSHANVRVAGSHNQAPIQGGHVIEPTMRLVTDPIVVIDFASLYPTVMAANGIGRAQALPDIVEMLMRRRRSTQDANLARVCKLVANSVYGQLASSTSPLYDAEAANAITAEGRKNLQNLVEFVRGEGWFVVYGDTDSCMITRSATDPAACESCAQECISRFNDTLPAPMRVKLEDTFSTSVFLSKKKYIGVTRSGRLHYRGTINVRSDVPTLCQRLFECLSRALLVDECRVDGATEMVMTARETFSSATADQMKALRKLTSLEKGGEGALAPHVELVRKEMMREDGLGYGSEDSIDFVPCRPIVRAGAQPSGWVCESTTTARARGVEWRCVWKAYYAAAISLIDGVLGQQAADAVRGAVASCEKAEREAHMQRRPLFAE